MGAGPRIEQDWRPGAELAVLRRRAALLAAIRRFFAERGVLEVETPVLSAAGATDPNLESFRTRYQGPGAPLGLPLYLQTSPEFPMKRLLAAGSGPIYQVCKVFRQGEAGRRHNPEFTLLEWYRPGFDHHALMDEVAELVGELLGTEVALQAPERLSYRQAFETHAGIDPHHADSGALRACLQDHGVTPPAALAETERDAWLDLLLTHVVEPRLGRGRLTFLYDYPASQAALARIVAGDPPVAERFELYLEGIELANGFYELGDAAEQQARFVADGARRRAQGQDEVAADARLVAALRAGLPDCAGVALGLDRLLMLAAGCPHIEQVLAFPIERA